MVDEREIQEDLRKVSQRKVIYLCSGIGLFAIGAALMITFMIRRELPALLLCVVALIWGALLLNQALRTRDLQDTLTERLEDRAGEAGAQAPAVTAGDKGTCEEPGKPGGGGGSGEP